MMRTSGIPEFYSGSINTPEFPQNEVAVVGETVAGHAASLRKKLLGLSEDLKERTFDLAELLEEAKKDRLYISWGYSTLGEYSETELNIKERKARYLVRIVEVCQAIGVPRPKYEPVGVTKLREITSLDPKGSFFNQETGANETMEDHILRLLEAAEGMKTPQVVEEVMRLKGQTGENAMVTRSFSITRACWEGVIKPAQELARRVLGSKGRDDDGKAIEYPEGVCEEAIHAEFLASITEETPQVTLEEDDPPMPQDIPLDEST